MNASAGAKEVGINEIKREDKRRFRYGTNSIVLTVVVIVVAVIVNVVLESLPLTIDLTEQKLYSLTKDSIRLLDNIEKEGKEVEITALYDRVREKRIQDKALLSKCLTNMTGTATSPSNMWIRTRILRMLSIL